LQIAFNEYLARAIPISMLPILGKAVPSIGQLLQLKDNPVALHYSLEKVINQLQEVLEHDHEAGVLCLNHPESQQSVSGGGDRNGEVDAGGSSDTGVHESILETETTSQNIGD